jgi:hypothetical protein
MFQQRPAAEPPPLHIEQKIRSYPPLFRASTILKVVSCENETLINCTRFLLRNLRTSWGR